MRSRPTTTVLGVDGARRGWVGIALDGPAGLAALFSPTLAGLLDHAGDVAAVAIDIPIELEAGARRSCDVAARGLLGPRRSSIFPAPALGTLAFDDDDYPGANAFSKATTGHGLSKQAWFLVPKIRDARAVDDDRPGLLHEVSPELSFAAMNDGQPLPHAKTTWAGLAGRLRLLADAGLVIPDDVGPAGLVAPDDIVDAAALAWSARRIRDGVARSVPDASDGARIRW